MKKVALFAVNGELMCFDPCVVECPRHETMEGMK